MIEPSAGAPIAVYEQPALLAATGGALHPGGLDLTRRLLEGCPLPTGARLLDIGCGGGASLSWLRERQFQTTGLDLSLPLLSQAVGNRLDVVQAQAFLLPFPGGAFDALLCECSLSVISLTRQHMTAENDRILAETLAETRRVLHPGGYLLISDVYARRPEGLPALRDLAPFTCLRGALDLSALQRLLVEAGFRIEQWEDHSHAIRQMTSELCQGYGSLQGFWDQAAGAPVDAFDVAVKIGRARPGYFTLIARQID